MIFSYLFYCTNDKTPANIAYSPILISDNGFHKLGTWQ